MPNTTCAHNAEGQRLIAGVATPCRKCGAMIEPAAGSQGIAGGPVAAAYPGEAPKERGKKGQGRNDGGK